SRMTSMRLHLHIACIFAGISALIVACDTKPSATQASDAGAAQPKDASAVDSGEDDDVRPVYPIDATLPPSPLAQKLCGAIHDTREDRRMACCGSGNKLRVTSECVRMLTASLHANAMTANEAGVDACAQAITKQFEGCDWVGPFTPGPPAA